MATIVYQYGTRTRMPGPDGTYVPLGLPEEAMGQVRLVHHMRNQLVRHWLDHDEATRNLWSSHPEVAEIEKEIAEAEAVIAEIRGQIKAQHTADRTIKTRPEVAAWLRVNQKNLKGLKEKRRKTIGDTAYLQLKDRLEELRQKYKDGVKAIRQEYAEKGLHWGSYNSAVDDDKTSVDRIKALRSQGKPATRRFKGWDGAGTITLQLQRPDGAPVRSPALLAGGGHRWQNVFTLTKIDGDPEVIARMTDAERKNNGHDRGTLTWRIGKTGSFELPITVHRPIPPEADITGAQLTIKRVGPRKEITVAITVKLPDPPPKEGPGRVALHTGHRRRPDGSVRVATWGAASPMNIPSELQDVVVGFDGNRWGEIVLPAAWLERAEKAATVRARRDTNFNPMLEKFAVWLEEHPQEGDEDHPPLLPENVRKWRAHKRLAQVVREWLGAPEGPPKHSEEILDLLKAWAKQDKHLWAWETSLRVKVTRRRDDAWGRVAHWLSDQCPIIVLDSTNLAELRRKPKDGDDDPVLPGAQQAAARARAALCAPGMLRQKATQTAARMGVTVGKVSSTHLSRTCPHCHKVGDAHPRYAAASLVTCPYCNHSYDQDRSAVALMLTREWEKERPKRPPRPRGRKKVEADAEEAGEADEDASAEVGD